ncbi:MAG: GGDEF domain-containing protein, partial [Mariprofundus sp.]
NTRNSDLAARIGGEEFCIVFPSTSEDDSYKLAEALRQAVEIHAFSTARGLVDVTVSIGVAEHAAGTTHASTFKAADKALYQSKHNGRNRVSIAGLTQA